MAKTRKIQKWKKPEFAANPVLFMVREGLSEVKHIEAALRQIEHRLVDPGGQILNPDTELPRLNLEGWIASLAETYIAIAYLAHDPRMTGHGANGVSTYLKGQIDAAEFEWGGAAQAARHMLEALVRAHGQGGVGRLISGALAKSVPGGLGGGALAGIGPLIAGAVGKAVKPGAKGTLDPKVLAGLAKSSPFGHASGPTVQEAAVAAVKGTRKMLKNLSDAWLP